MYGIRFGSKHYIMVKLANVYWVGINDPFLVHFTCDDHPNDSFGTKTGHFGPSDGLFRGQKADFGTSGGPKRA